MAVSLFGRTLTRTARVLEHEDMERFGLANTTRLARWFNRANAPLIDARRTLYETRFDALLEENGPPKGVEQFTLQDGFALDTAGSLPHLEPLIAQMNEVIEERGLRVFVDKRKPYLQNILPDDAIERYASLIDFGTSSSVLAAVAPAFGYIPAFSRSMPDGIRLQESSTVHDPTPTGPWRDSQDWHRDYHSLPTVYVITLIREVTDECGPLHYISASASERVSRRFRYRSRRCAYRLTDKQVYSVVDPAEVHTLVGPPGTTLVIDSSACFHMGSRNPVVPRYQTQYAYFSPVRSDFSEISRRQLTYPALPSDSTLRQMVCDRDWRPPLTPPDRPRASGGALQPASVPPSRQVTTSRQRGR